MRWALALAVFAGAASLRILDAVLPAIAQDLQTNLGTTGVIVSAYALSYGICQILYGPMGDRKGLLRVIVWAAAGSALAAAACAAAPSLHWLIVGRLAAGGVAAAIGPLALAWISSETVQAKRAVAVARMSSASIIGTTAGQVGGGLVGQAVGWRACFLVLAALFACAALALRGLTERTEREATSQATARSGPVALAGLLRLPAVRWVLFCVGVEGLGMYVGLAYLSALLRQRLAVDTAGAGLLVAFFGVGGCAFVVVAHRLVNRWPEPARATVGGCLAGVGFLGVALATSAAAAAAALFVLGLGFFLLHNIFQVRATEMAPQATGAGVSLFAATFFVAQAVGAAIGGRLVDGLGAQAPAFVSAAILTCFGLTAGWWFLAAAPRPPERFAQG